MGRDGSGSTPGFMAFTNICGAQPVVHRRVVSCCSASVVAGPTQIVSNDQKEALTVLPERDCEALCARHCGCNDTDDWHPGYVLPTYLPWKNLQRDETRQKIPGTLVIHQVLVTANSGIRKNYALMCFAGCWCNLSQWWQKKIQKEALTV